jgi:hypothetical protein
VGSEYDRWTFGAQDMVDVSEAEDATAGSGHGHFRNSPWVSSDVLVSLLHGLPPAEWGLVQDAAQPVWRFPPDYIERLRAGVLRAAERSQAPRARSAPCTSTSRMA